MPSHHDLRLLRYFVEVVRAGSIRKAADELRLSPTVVSEALAQLEDKLGVTLLKRTTRTMRLTSIGQEVFGRAADMASAGEQALELARKAAAKPAGPLSLTIPGELCLSWLPGPLKSFEAAFPEVEATVVVDDTAVALDQSDFDVAIRAEFSKSAQARSDVLRHIPLDCVCAPDWTPESAPLSQSLGRIGLIGRPGAPLGRQSVWAAKAGDGAWIDAPCRFHTTEHVVSHRLALEGFGAVLLMRPTVAEDLAENRLVSVSPAHSFGFVAVSAKFRDKHPTAAARALGRHLLDLAD